MSGAVSEILPTVPETEGVAIVIPRHLAARFEEAEEQIKAAYNMAPGIPILVNLWLACGSPAHIRHEFEMAVLGITKPGFEFENDGDDNEI